MRVLMVSNRVKTYPQLYKNILEVLKELGHEIIWAADFSNLVTDKSAIPVITEQIPINTNPFNLNNYKAYRQLLLIIDKYKIESVLCSTPIGGTLARLAAKKKKITPVIYTAHGFLFFKGAPLINRTLFKWHEQWLAHYTDALITIIDEDYEAAKKLKLRSGKAPYMIHGAGINVGVKVNVDRAEKRKSIGIPEDAFVIISAGDLNKNKNTEVMVRALGELKDPLVHYIACGVGSEEENLQKLAKSLGVESQFHLLGYRTDVPELMASSDAFAIMSFREGLPRSLMEAMDLGLPCIGSDTRGVRDLIDPEGGFVCNPRKQQEFAKAVRAIRNLKIEEFQWDQESQETQVNQRVQDLTKMGEYNKGKVKSYSVDVVRHELYDIYKNVLGEDGK